MVRKAHLKGETHGDDGDVCLDTQSKNSEAIYLLSSSVSLPADFMFLIQNCFSFDVNH